MELKEAIEQFNIHARGMHAVVELATHLKRIGDLELAAKEAENAAVRAFNDLSTLRADIVKETERGRVNRANMKVTIEKETEAMLSAAQAGADKIVADAQARAASLTSQAEARANDAENAAKTALANQVAAVDAVSAAQKELSALEAKIEKARQTVAKLMNA